MEVVFFRILVRAISYTVHGLIPASCVFADRYNREEVVRSLGNEVNICPALTLGQLPDTPEELLKLDQVRKCNPCFMFSNRFLTLLKKKYVFELMSKIDNYVIQIIHSLECFLCFYL